MFRDDDIGIDDFIIRSVLWDYRESKLLREDFSDPFFRFLGKLTNNYDFQAKPPA